MGETRYNTGVNHIKSDGLLSQRRHPFSTDVRGIVTMFDHTPFFPENLTDYAPWVAEHGLFAPYGECQCGCGKAAPIAKGNDSRDKCRAGHPKRFVSSHNRRVVDRKKLTRILNEGRAGDTRLIPLTRGKVAVVDAADYDELMKYKWNACPHRYTWYALASILLPDGKRRVVQMHRVILGCSDNIAIDHKDGDGLNNTRENLRPATISQNNRNSRIMKSNTSGYKGVHKRIDSGRYRAYISVNGKKIDLGTYDNAVDAAVAYDLAAKQYGGEFAKLNFPDAVPDLAGVDLFAEHGVAGETGSESRLAAMVADTKRATARCHIDKATGE